MVEKKTASREEARKIIEAFIFAAKTPVPFKEIALLLPEVDVALLLQEIALFYQERGIVLKEGAEGFYFATAVEAAPYLQKKLTVRRKFTRATAEILAIIAWQQPITRAEIEAIRGVSISSQNFEPLLEAGLIMPKGRKESPGRPVLWGTSPKFPGYFGLKSLKDLPNRHDLFTDLPD